MGESNGDWGQLAADDPERAAVWDECAPIPDPGDNPALDAFVERKGITHASLVRIGARMADYSVFAFAGPGYLKFRDFLKPKGHDRWSYVDCDWSKMRLVLAGTEPATTCILAEGETDATWLTDHYACDVAIMPAGAEYFPDTYADQLRDYELVLVGIDTDSAGERGAAKVIAALPNAMRFAPPGNDWCSSPEDQLPALPSPADLPERPELKVLWTAGEVIEAEPPEIVSWFEHALLPVGGSLILHGWAKSYKSFLALDMMAALAQGQDWATFEPTEEPCKVAVMQYEIPWAYYQGRIKQLGDSARELELFKTNFLTFTPLRRPNFVAGNTASEDAVLRTLIDSRISVFLLDPVRRATGIADLNSEKEVRPLLHFFERVQNEGITVVTVHHDNKNGSGDERAMTGSGAFAGDFDTIVTVSLPKGKTRDDPERNLHFLLRNAPSPGSRGMIMDDDGITYSPEVFGDWNEEEGSPAI